MEIWDYYVWWSKGLKTHIYGVPEPNGRVWISVSDLKILTLLWRITKRYVHRGDPGRVHKVLGDLEVHPCDMSGGIPRVVPAQ